MVFLVFALLLIFNPIGVQASWFTDDKEVKSFLIKYQNELHFTKGGIGSIIGQMFTWTLIRGAYWICKTIQGLVPEALSIFDFVESTGISEVYTSIVNTIVVSLMVLTLIIIGFKMITQKNALDIKTVGMNIVVSVILILLMPTMITSGIKFSKTFYDDSTSITKSEGGIAWKMIEDGVTDLVYINKQKAYDKLGQNSQKKNALKEKDFFVYDLGEIITPDTAKDLEDDNKDAKFLQYKLSPDGEGNMVPVKIDSSWMAIFSDSFKGGYYRYTKDTFSLVIGLIALAIAYLFSAFIIITAIIELSIKRVLGILVFATDLESGQRSKMVLSDIMQCFLTVGFQGFNMSIFAMFISFMGSGGGASVNPIIKTIAYVSSVFVLIKGSETIMRYFGVDIGVKEGFAQMATALGMSAMMLRGGKNIAGRFGRSNNNGDKDDSDTSNKPEKNFGNSIKDYANKVGRSVGYGMERGIDGLAADGVNMATDKATKPIRGFRNAMKNTRDSFKDGIDDGTVNAIKKGMDLKNTNGREDSIKEQPKNNLKNSINNSPLDRANNIRAVDPRIGNGHNNSIRQQVDENIRRRNSNNANGSQMDRSREEFIRQKYQNSNRNVEASTREQLINAKEKIQSSGLDSASGKERILNTKENIQSHNLDSAAQMEKSINIKENIKPSSGSSGISTTQREQIINTKENIKPSGASSIQREQIVNVKENIQPSNGTSPIQKEQIINTRENIQPSSGSKTIHKEQNIDIIENVKSNSNGLNNNNKQSVIVKEHLEEREKLINSKKFNLKGNSLFEDNSDKKNSLFDI